MGRHWVNSSSAGLIDTAQGHCTQHGSSDAEINFDVVGRKGVTQGRLYCAQG